MQITKICPFLLFIHFTCLDCKLIGVVTVSHYMSVQCIAQQSPDLRAPDVMFIHMMKCNSFEPSECFPHQLALASAGPGSRESYTLCPQQLSYACLEAVRLSMKLQRSPISEPRVGSLMLLLHTYMKWSNLGRVNFYMCAHLLSVFSYRLLPLSHPWGHATRSPPLCPFPER